MSQCVFCAAPVTDEQDFYRVIGWEHKATSASRKSGSDIVLRERVEPAEWACRWCIDKLKRGVSIGQDSLL